MSRCRGLPNDEPPSRALAVKGSDMPLDSTLSFTSRAHRMEALIRSTLRTLNHLTRPAIEAMGLTLPRLWVLVHVEGQPGLTMSELARRMTLSRSAITALVDELVKAEWVVRDADPSDRRVIRLFLTPAGRETMNRALDVRVAVVEEALDRLSAHEGDALLAGLEKLAGQLMQLAVSPKSG